MVIFSGKLLNYQSVRENGGFLDQCHSLLICFRTAFLFHLGSWLSIDQKFFQAWNYTPSNDWFFSNDSFPILSKYPSVLNVFHDFMLFHVDSCYVWIFMAGLFTDIHSFLGLKPDQICSLTSFSSARRTLETGWSGSSTCHPELAPPPSAATVSRCVATDGRVQGLGQGLAGAAATSPMGLYYTQYNRI